MEKTKINGLSEKQAKALLKKYGPNEITKKEKSAWERLLVKFWSPIPWMIETAAVLSAIAGRWEEFFIIVFLLLVNVFVDYFQESKAVNALKVLKRKLAGKALVLRDNHYKNIDARYLVPGDIIKIKIGDIVPADVELVDGKFLEIDQSVLTGESLPVNKKAGDIVYANSIVKMGEMIARVTKTGMNTFFGKSATLVAKALREKKSHFQKAIINIGNFLIVFTAILAVLILAVSVFRHDNLLEVLRFLLVLAVASIPVALPAVLSVTMAVGAMAIVRRRAIVSNLPAIEELAGISILCSDKTGTLTQNKMTVNEPLVYGDFSLKELFTYAVLASQKENNDPIEEPIFSYWQKNFSDSKLKEYKCKDFIPFDPIRKRTEARFIFNKEDLTIIKGAPQVVVSLCVQDDASKKILADVEKMADKGFRTLAVAIKKNRQEFFTCVGLIPLFDPPRADSAAVIKEVRQMGIDIKMVTGDNHAIAVQIANLLNIGDNILDTSELKGGDHTKDLSVLSEVIAKGLYKKLKIKAPKKQVEEFGKKISAEVSKHLGDNKITDEYIKKHESDIIDLIDEANGFSQVLPEDKYFIIDKLQKASRIVAMTGDGVNDAPALQKADVGIAVSGATDAARAAADLILLSPGLSVIVHAITIARKTFERMKGYAIFRIAETTRIILFMALSIILFNFYPISAIMVVMLALLNDIPIMMIAYDNAPTSSRPVDWNMKEVLFVAAVLGFTGVFSSFLFFYWLRAHNVGLALIQALLFVKLDVAGHSTIYLTRTGRRHFWQKPYPSWKFFIPAFGSRIIGTLIALFGIFMVKVNWLYIVYVWIYALIWWFINDYAKVFTYKMIDRFKLSANK